jgi:predicted dehydrogenase
MIEKVELDAAQINTPDHIHAGPTIDCLEAGLDVVVPKPTASTLKDAHAMIETAKKTGRLLGIDFHKREDPRIKEAEARFQSGRYGEYQTSVWYMLDKLMVADPNHEPRFFASADYAKHNTPVSFLTVHMCDALLKVINLRPVEVRATGFSHKLPNLSPISVDGYDMCDTEIRFENGGSAHIITGWHIPNTAHATTEQDSRIICSDGMIDLTIDRPGFHELHEEGIAEVNPLFKNFEKDGTVTGYGISSPGRFYQKFLADRNGTLTDEVKADMMTPTALGLFTTLVLEGGEKSLEQGKKVSDGVTVGSTIDLCKLINDELGAEAAASYGY